MTWIQTIPTFAAALVVMFGPGLAVLAAAGVRRLNLAALAAPVSASVAGCTAVVAPFVRLPFNPVVYFVVSAVLVVGTLAVRILWRRRSSQRHGGGVLASNGPLTHLDLGRWIVWAGVPLSVAFAALVIGRRYILGFGAPEDFSQTFDNIYHLNAIRYIEDHANGSSLTLGNLTDASHSFYPAAMHDSMALILQLAGGPVPVVVNVATIVIGALVWPLSCLFLISRIVGYRPVPLMAAGALSAGFSAFPYLMVAFGVLYPNHAAIALMPAVLGLAIEALGMARSQPSSPLPPILALVATFPGLALTHPSTAIGLLGFAVPVVWARFFVTWGAWRKRTTSRRALRVWGAFALVYSIGVAGIWYLLRPSLSAAPWAPFQSNARAIGEVLANAPMGTTVAWILTPLTFIGLYVLARQLRRLWWVLAMYAIGGALYVVVSSWNPGWLRTFLTGVWYNDSFRLAAILPVVALPVAILGAEWLLWRLRAGLELAREWAAGTKRLSPLAASAAPRWQGITAIVVSLVILVMGVGSQGGTLSSVQDRIHQVFTLDANSMLVDSDERALLQQVPGIVPAGDTIVANPLMGGSLVYALEDRRTVAPHVFGDRNPTEAMVLNHWDEAAYNSRVCPAIKELRAYWALDFGDKTVIPSDDPFVGLNDLATDSAPGVKLVAEVGHARLFRVNCP
ncbi:hypothetical protein SA2016_2613 [Sinomonas atrocyanea]|uniref:Uncharacterized protein n=1 Tax=Sinomonas atrocyanea TaxID=37927 RepID=A0A127A1F4_9MICC|nr:DUF6541 family protein [Sinomonas atrocyanea]AMM33280.1 hypothetical protein SA2016_2613 [Sinomonas atrocyanea]GEB63624.1 hypothetical protein SAT01_10720 [Sinomonas atrocyanea]GGG57945.1 hypothetical protein GCM10007172_05950 [Sinomonas atrocyanea]